MRCPALLLATTLALSGCHHAMLRCLLLDSATCPGQTTGGSSSLSAPLPPAPPDPCTSGAATTNNQCSPNPLSLATACDPTDADGDPYDDDCTPAAPTPHPNHP